MYFFYKILRTWVYAPMFASTFTFYFSHFPEIKLHIYQTFISSIPSI